MAETIFKFFEDDERNDRFDINLCANRTKLYLALTEVNNLRRSLYNGKTYKTRCLYKIGEHKSEWYGNETDYSTIKPENVDDEKYVEMIDVDWIIRQLDEALEEVISIIDE
jgi:hypothetical protein